MELDEIKIMYEENDLWSIDKFEDHQSAIIGISTLGDGLHLIYSYDKLAQSFMKRDGMTMEEAEEWIGRNVVQSLPYHKPYEPILVHEICK